MQVVILAGGLGTRLAEETEIKPKPMIEIGEQPILWHIIKHYSHYGFEEFFIALGYRGEVIKRYFVDYANLKANLTIHMNLGRVEIHQTDVEDWKVHLINTGQETMTGGRLMRLQPYLKNETFMLTYGDGVSNIDLSALLQFHREQGCIATVSAVRPPARFGGLLFDGNLIAQFTEKPQIGEGWINGGFMVFEPSVFEYIHDDADSLERDVLEMLAIKGQLAAYRHDRFWQCMDTLRDKRLLEQLWREKRAEWKVWD